MSDEQKTEFQKHLEAIEEAHPNFEIADLHPHEKSTLILYYVAEDMQRGVGIFKEAIENKNANVAEAILQTVLEGNPNKMFGVVCYVLGEAAFSRIQLRLEAIRSKQQTKH